MGYFRHLVYAACLALVGLAAMSLYSVYTPAGLMVLLFAILAAAAFWWADRRGD